MGFFNFSPRLWALITPLAAGFFFALWWRRRGDSGEDDGGAEFRRPPALGSARNGKVTVDLSIPGSAVGWVIGREGQNIRKIEQQTGCRVKMRDRGPNEERGCDQTATLIGHPSQVEEAERLVQEVVAQKLAKDAQARAEKFTVELTIPSRAVGRVIGRQGQTIRSIERASGARVRIDRGSDQMTEDRICVITGTGPQVDAARHSVEEKIQEEDELRVKRAQSRPVRLPTDTTEDEVQKVDVDWSSLVARLPQTKEFVPVYVAAIETVHRFYVQHVAPESSQLDELAVQMTDDYSRTNAIDALVSVSVGDVCAAPFQHDDRWYRARVMELFDGELGVLYLDFGDFGYIRREQAKPLR